MRIHIHAGAFRLLEQLFHVLQVVTGDENAGMIADTEMDLCNFRMPVGFGIGLIQKRHGVHSRLTGFHDHGDHCLHGKISGRGRQRFQDEGIDILFFIA